MKGPPRTSIAVTVISCGVFCTLSPSQCGNRCPCICGGRRPGPGGSGRFSLVTSKRVARRAAPVPSPPAKVRRARPSIFEPEVSTRWAKVSIIRSGAGAGGGCRVPANAARSGRPDGSSRFSGEQPSLSPRRNVVAKPGPAMAAPRVELGSAEYGSAVGPLYFAAKVRPHFREQCNFPVLDRFSRNRERLGATVNLVPHWHR